MTITEKILLELIKNKPKSLDEINAVKRRFLRTNSSSRQMPSSKELLQSYHKLVKGHKIKPAPDLEKILIKRAVRTLSGVAIITVLTKPFPCPGRCVYCPSEPGMPKSYISDEPAANRALKLKFDPFKQVYTRIKALEANGHPTDKIELIIKGGTWNAYPLDYQYWFILRCFQACNKCLPQKDFERVMAAAAAIPEPRGEESEKTFCGGQNKKLSIQQTKNENAKHRIIGITLETRPDVINDITAQQMREMGCTRIEMGVQTTDEKTLKKIRRGHNVQAVKNATKLLKKYGFKVDYHLMPQLPGATPAKDLQMMLSIFSDTDFRPDMIKIYPCTVIKNTELYNWLKAGKYKPYSDKKLVDTLIKFKCRIPRYVRISRLIRDIPGGHIMAGNKMTNLRQVIQAEMKNTKLKCKCLRCREVGHQGVPEAISAHQIKLFMEKYKASGGYEYFFSFEDKKRNTVYAFCRLRLDKNGLYPAFIRELHTYGKMIQIGKNEKNASQHTGLGGRLMQEAEKICRKNKVKKLAVIAGVGVREYYRKLGYKLENTYMVKPMI
jgi:elongator complex protein 3